MTKQSNREIWHGEYDKSEANGEVIRIGQWRIRSISQLGLSDIWVMLGDDLDYPENIEHDSLQDAIDWALHWTYCKSTIIRGKLFWDQCSCSDKAKYL